MVAAVLAGLLATFASTASAAVPAKTDVMIIFDTSGSMEGVLNEAKEEIKELIANTETSLPDVEFGVANVEDYPGYLFGVLEEEKDELEYEEDLEKPWRLDQALTSNQADVETAIEELSGPEVAHAGGDAPESYGRALWETDRNPNVGWRAGARHEIIMIGDQVPHTNNVNEAIPEELWLANPFDTGEELPGKWGIPGTPLKTGEKLEFHEILRTLGGDEKPLAMVDYFHTYTSESENYIHYWEYWAAATGGQAISAAEGSKSLDAKLTEIIKESAEGIPPCPPGYARTPSTPCTKIPAPPGPPGPSSPPPLEPIVYPSSPPKEAHHVVVYVYTGEVEGEWEFPEGGEAEVDAEVVSEAELASLGHGQFAFQPYAFATTTKKCKKGDIRKDGKCVGKKPVVYGRIKVKLTAAGKHKFRFKPTHSVLTALKQGKTVHVRLKLTFKPTGTAINIVKTSYVTVHLKKKHKH
ncbi:MAG: vWA domain-containing protein [Solirubrobacteraceae bacterium]